MLMQVTLNGYLAVDAGFAGFAGIAGARVPDGACLITLIGQDPFEGFCLRRLRPTSARASLLQ